MSTSPRFFESKRFRKEFGKYPPLIEIPDLIEVQKKSYEKFLQADKAQNQRENLGLHGVFKSVFPIHDFNNTASLSVIVTVDGTSDIATLDLTYNAKAGKNGSAKK